MTYMVLPQHQGKSCSSAVRAALSDPTGGFGTTSTGLLIKVMSRLPSGAENMPLGAICFRSMMMI